MKCKILFGYFISNADWEPIKTVRQRQHLC